MRTHLLLCNKRHGAMIVPVISSLHTRLIRISPSCWTIFRSFEIILEWELPTALEFEFNFPRKSHFFKKHSIWYEEYLKKLQRAARALTNEPSEPMRTWLIHITPSYWKFFIRLQLFSNGDCQLDGNSNSMFQANLLLQKSI